MGRVDPSSTRGTSDGVYRCEPRGDDAGCGHGRDWRPPRQMDSWFEEQLTAYPEDALTLAPLHLGEWHPPLLACGRCQHKDKATSRSRCPCHRERWRTAARAAGGHQRIPDGDILLVVSNLPGSRTCLGEQGRGTHDWAAVPWGQYVAPQVVAVLEFQRWAQVVRRFVEDL